MQAITLGEAASSRMLYTLLGDVSGDSPTRKCARKAIVALESVSRRLAKS